MTTKHIEEILKNADPGFEIIPLQVRGYSWTAGFNGPAALLAEGLKKKGKTTDGISMLHLSFAVSFHPSELARLSAAIEKKGTVFMARDNADHEIPSRAEVGSYIRHPELLLQSDMKTSALLQLARNTASIIPLENIVRLKGYRSSLNEVGGMEDHDFSARLLLHSLKKEDWGAVKQLLKGIGDPIRYQDADWLRLDQAARQAKLTNEQQAVKKIIGDLVGMQAGVDPFYRTPESEQDFIFPNSPI